MFQTWTLLAATVFLAACGGGGETNLWDIDFSKTGRFATGTPDSIYGYYESADGGSFPIRFKVDKDKMVVALRCDVEVNGEQRELKSQGSAAATVDIQNSTITLTQDLNGEGSPCKFQLKKDSSFSYTLNEGGILMSEGKLRGQYKKLADLSYNSN